MVDMNRVWTWGLALAIVGGFVFLFAVLFTGDGTAAFCSGNAWCQNAVLFAPALFPCVFGLITALILLVVRCVRRHHHVARAPFVDADGFVAFGGL